jgi:hypothetical protein
MKNFHKLPGKKIRITGVSTPIGGVSIEYDKSERQAIEGLLTFLEDRRVLYNFVSTKCPKGVIKSVQEIRERVEAVREKVSRDSMIFQISSAILDTVFNFLEYACKDCMRLSTCNDCVIYEKGCTKGLLEFRKQMGFHINILCSEFGLKVHGDLKHILPNNQGLNPPYGICPESFNKNVD